ncbi:TetR/AcrR family transcriptional regulator [Aliiglaciecola sp. 3_MG-2023]|uniref:TetR/AcrR family transcriptional regulator n=1 Tax=Aliiglaciecola sp. 3_MG-2023 TaxID=3062644 RepID=UPI0026E15503|nr:TetR/AcrR family transcriptional regulator [Aliiglaciecola sp. 3_MG-2023]MDO6693173.1 TetR/AcrR family transcriptional regulator [Aliiglaciecola sp. 3_MG-2023]
MNNTNNSTVRGRPRKLDRKEGLKKALALFQDHGFENVSVAELSATLNATATSIYATYGNKEDLFLAALGFYKDQFWERLEKMLADSQNPSEMFRNSLEMSLEFYLNENRRSGCLILQGHLFCRNKSILNEISKLQKELQTSLQNRLQKLGSENPEELADVLITLMGGIALSVKSESDEDKLYTTLEFFCTAFEC